MMYLLRSTARIWWFSVLILYVARLVENDINASTWRCSMA